MNLDEHQSARRWRMVSLLLDPRGTIGRREYVAGICVLLFVMVGLMVTTAIPIARVWLFQRPIGVEYFRAYGFQAVLSEYLPAFLPFGFLLFAGSVALSMKRARGAGLSSAIGILGALLTFLFLSTLRAACILIALVRSQSDGGGLEASGLSFASLVGVTVVLGVLGLLQVVLFATIGGKWRQTEDCPEARRMDAVGYPLFLAKTMAIGILGTAVLVLACYVFPMIRIARLENALSLVLGLGMLWIVVRSIVGMCLRMRDAGYCFWALPSTILGLVALVVFSGWLIFFMDAVAGVSMVDMPFWKIGLIDYALQFGLYLALSLCFVPLFVPEWSSQESDRLADTPGDRNGERPKWLTVIAVLMMIGAVIGFVGIFMLTEENSILMGFKIPVPVAVVLALIAHALALYCSVGFLRLDETARRVYIPLALYGIVNTIISWPALIKSVGGDPTMRRMMGWMLVWELLIDIAILVYVIRIRDRFRKKPAL